MLTPYYDSASVLSAAKVDFSEPVADFFASSPNSVIDTGGELTLATTPDTLHPVPTEIIPAVVQTKQFQLKEHLAPDLESFVREGKGRWPAGFDGARMNALHIDENETGMMLHLAHSTFSLRRALEELVLNELPGGSITEQDLMTNGKMFEPRELHMHAIMYAQGDVICLQERGLSDGTDTLHLCGISGGFMPVHMEAEDPLRAAMLTQLHREFGDALDFGIDVTGIRALSHERLRVGAHGASTQYLAGVSRLKLQNGSLPTVQDICTIVEDKFKKNALMTIPGTDDTLPVNRWQVKGYAFAHLDPKKSLMVRDDTLYVSVTRIKASADANGLYNGAILTTAREWMPVYHTIAPTARFYMNPESPVSQSLRA